MVIHRKADLQMVDFRALRGAIVAIDYQSCGDDTDTT